MGFCACVCCSPAWPAFIEHLLSTRCRRPSGEQWTGREQGLLPIAWVPVHRRSISVSSFSLPPCLPPLPHQVFGSSGCGPQGSCLASNHSHRLCGSPGPGHSACLLSEPGPRDPTVAEEAEDTILQIEVEAEALQGPRQISALPSLPGLSRPLSLTHFGPLLQAACNQ